MKRIRKKLNSARGESIAEVLVALLISALGLALLAVMITSSVRIIERGRKAVADYVVQENALVERSGSSELTGSFVLTDGTGARKLTDSDLNASTNVVYYVNDVINGKPVISYRKKDN